MLADPDPLPWAVPVPLSVGGFVSLYPEHQRLDLVTNLSAIASFDIPRANRDILVGLADYQLDPELSNPARQGAGRAVFYDDFYLKGCGRTQLAGNWYNEGEAAHCSGHLPVSAALRELVVSRYLAKKGLQKTIVPCDGLLVRVMGDRFAASWQQAMGANRLSPCDTRLQALSVKPGPFGRWSNLFWLAQHTAVLSESFIALGTAALRFALAPGAPAVSPAAASPSKIAAELAAAFLRGYEHFETFVCAGIYWGSFHNNFTLDGRFLDLEVPLIVGEGLCARVANLTTSRRTPDFTTARICGWEIGFYRRQVHNIVRGLEFRMRELARMSKPPMLHNFAEQLGDALVTAFHAEHLLRAREPFIERMRALYQNLGASPALAASMVDHIENDGHPVYGIPSSLAVQSTSLRFERIESGLDVVVAPIAGAPGFCHPQAAHERALLRTLFDELDHTTDPEVYLERVRNWLAILDRELSPSA